MANNYYGYSYNNTTLRHFDDTDGPPGEWVNTVSEKYITSSSFTLTNFLLFRLPAQMEVKDASHFIYHARNMRCPLATKGFPQMCQRSGYTCWCKFISQIWREGKGKRSFIMARQGSENNIHHAYGMIVNGKIKNKNVPRDQMRVNMTITFSYNINTREHDLVLNYPIMVKDELKPQTIATDKGITAVEFSFQLDENFPRYFEVTHYSTIYRTAQKYTCHFDPQKSCPSGEGDECFCTLLNQVRAGGSGQVIMDLHPYKSSSNYVSFQIRIHATRNTPKQLKMKVDMIYKQNSYNYHHY